MPILCVFLLLRRKHGQLKCRIFLSASARSQSTGGGGILQIYTAKRAGDHVDGIDDLVNIFALDAQGECVHVAKGLEEDALAFHNRHTGLGADVAQTQDGSAVGDHGAEVVTPGQFVGFVHILVDLDAGLGHAGGVGQTQVVFCGNGHGGDDFDLATPLAVQAQGFFCICTPSELLLTQQMTCNEMAGLYFNQFGNVGSHALFSCLGATLAETALRRQIDR